ncbi:hypothetical protein [Streptomyces sp. 5-10]|nr:hypothetical protein [Streptomyces sp. 5-10]
MWNDTDVFEALERMAKSFGKIFAKQNAAFNWTDFERACGFLD